MNRFTFKTVSPSLFDCQKSFDAWQFTAPVCNIGEVVNIGKYGNNTALYIKSAKLHEGDFSILDSLPEHGTLSKVIQYVPSISGYLAAYTSM